MIVSFNVLIWLQMSVISVILHRMVHRISSVYIAVEGK